MKKFFLLLTVALIFLTACGVEYKQIHSLDDLRDARIGAWPESAYHQLARKKFPNAQFVAFEFISDLMLNLSQHKIDAFIIGEIYVENLNHAGNNVKYLSESLGDVPLSYGFTKNERGRKLCAQMNEFIATVEANGELDALRQKWFFGDDGGRTFAKSKLTGENGTLKVGTELGSMPFCYLCAQEVVGYEVELLDKFCAAYGYDYEIEIEDFTTMLTEVTTGRLDVAMDALEILPERQQNMLFANPTYTEHAVAVVSVESSDENFFAGMTRRIKISLVDENRWQMLAEGAFRTIYITLLAIIFGTLLGFGAYMLYREGNRRVNRIIDAIYRMLQGVPTMVMLLFAYYVVFAYVEMPASFVAATVFAVVLSITVFTLLKNGADAIPRGQTEAALALGFSERRAFVKFILPQIVRNLFASYQVALNVTLLETAVVGYISVQDLTKMGDMIRARTYDAFVPIIAVAVIYLLLSRLLLKLTDKLARRLDPKRRSREEILDGVKL